MNSKTPWQHFHFVFSLGYIKYGLILCVLPMLRALLIFDVSSLVSAFIQDIAILLAMLVIAFGLWRRASYYTTNCNIVIKYGILYNQVIAIPFSSVSVIECVRSPFMRIVGGTRVTLYFNNNIMLKKHSLYLPRLSADALCANIMPVKESSAVYEPSGGQRLIFAMLSINLLTSTFFALTFVSKLKEVLGYIPTLFTLSSFEQIAFRVAPFLPAGLALIATVLFVLFAFSFLVSFFLTAGFRVCRNGGVLITKSGVFTKLERRYLCRAINVCEIKISPITRLFRRYPVFIHAGSYHSINVPAFAFAKKEKNTLSRLLPELIWEAPKFNPPAARSIVPFLWKPAVFLLLSVALLLTAANALPDAVPILVLPIILCIICLLVSIEGFGCEGFYLHKNRSLSLKNTRFFTRRDYCVLTTDITLSSFVHPVSFSEGRCDIYLWLAAGLKLRARGIPLQDIQKISLPR